MPDIDPTEYFVRRATHIIRLISGRIMPAPATGSIRGCARRARTHAGGVLESFARYTRVPFGEEGDSERPPCFRQALPGSARR
jgi:hypothetical protein